MKKWNCKINSERKKDVKMCDTEIVFMMRKTKVLQKLNSEKLIKSKYYCIVLLIDSNFVWIIQWMIEILKLLISEYTNNNNNHNWNLSHRKSSKCKRINNKYNRCKNHSQIIWKRIEKYQRNQLNEDEVEKKHDWKIFINIWLKFDVHLVQWA